MMRAYLVGAVFVVVACLYADSAAELVELGNAAEQETYSPGMRAFKTCAIYVSVQMNAQVLENRSHPSAKCLGRLNVTR